WGIFDDMTARASFGAGQVDERTALAQAPPRFPRQILHPPYTDIAIDRYSLGFHEVVIRSVWSKKLAEAGPGFLVCRFLKCLFGRMIHNASLRKILRLEYATWQEEVA